MASSTVYLGKGTGGVRECGLVQSSLEMELLPFRLPDFCRLSWASDEAQRVWGGRIQSIVAAWNELEWISVHEGVRECCFVFATPLEFIDRGNCWAAHGLNALPLEMQGIPRGGYSSTAVSWKDGQPFQFRFVVGRPESVVQFREAALEGDDQAMGKLLGYPKCCREFFKGFWVDRGLVDTTWPMAMNTKGASVRERCIDANAMPPQSNILWRWMGIRAVSHLPCSFDCQPTINLANDLIALGRESGFAEEMGWLMEILQWPIEWSALHGIAEIKTPVLRVSARTDASAHKYIVRLYAESYPQEGAVGLQFPFQSGPTLRSTNATSFKKGLENPIVELSMPPAWLADDNGFTSEIAMNMAHTQLLEVAKDVLPDAETILDLGCGNGALLSRLLRKAPKASPFGIDSNATAIEHSYELFRKFSSHFVHGDLFDNESLWEDGRHYSLALIMPGRIIEQHRDKSERMLKRLAEQCDNVLAYAYGDWIKRYGTLALLAEAAGFIVIEDGATKGAAFVKVRTQDIQGCGPANHETR